MGFAGAAAMADEKEGTAHAYRENKENQECDEEVDYGLADFGVFMVASKELVQGVGHVGLSFAVLSVLSAGKFEVRLTVILRLLTSCIGVCCVFFVCTVFFWREGPGKS